MIARFDLALNTASFDFFTWLVLAAAKGATEVVFGIEKIKKGRWPEDVIRKRFHSIMEPGPALLGMPYWIGAGGIRPHGPSLIELVNWTKDGKSFPRLRSVLPPRDVEYTVTLRRNSYNPHRNSNEEAWRTFAKDIGALLIEDYDVKPIHLHERMALYAGAKMNFGVVTGPLHLCLLADYPVMLFSCNKEAEAYRLSGIEPGTNYPWAGRDQIAVWESDDLPAIRRNFEVWNGRR
jgi:hypothetical protein